MCEAAAFLLKDQKEELLLESVDVIETGQNDVTLVNIFGERKVIRAKMRSFSLVDHKIVLEPM
ncbi:MAG: CooT family nickel-binding protein [Desulfobacterales bacterium]|nr:CooT family nickel-binding protein [Desulfobacterales bacterium]